VVANPSVTDWISSVATAAIGVLGFLITGYQWRRSGFDPRLTSRIDVQRQGIELKIANKGRASGIIDQVDVAGRNNEILDAEYEGFSNKIFRSFALPAMASMRLIIQAPKGQPFEPGVRLLVGLGGTKHEEVTPVTTEEGVGIYGLTSVLPPGTPT
jgi:hypothetical protein